MSHICRWCVSPQVDHSDDDVMRPMVWPAVIGGSCPEYNFCRDKTFVATRVFLCVSRQTIMFVATNISRDKSFVATRICLCVSRQTVMSVATNISRDNCFVATKIFCRDKHNFFRDKTFVTQKWETFLSRLKWYMWQLPPMIVECRCGVWSVSARRPLQPWTYNYLIQVHDYNTQTFRSAMTASVGRGTEIQDYFVMSSEKLKRGWTLTTSQYTITWHILYILEL